MRSSRMLLDRDGGSKELSYFPIGQGQVCWQKKPLSTSAQRLGAEPRRILSAPDTENSMAPQSSTQSLVFMPESSSNSQQSLTTSSHVFLTFLSRPLTPQKARTEQACDGHHWELMSWKIWELSLPSVSPKRYLEGDGFVGLCCHQEVLPAPIGGLNPLLIC